MNKDTYVRLGSEIGARSAYRTFSRTFIPPEQSNLQNVFTEYWLCQDIVSKLEECAGVLRDKDWKVLCLNLEFVEVLLHEFGVKAENVWFVTDCQRKGEFALLPRYKGVKVHVTKDMLNWRADVKFDVVVGNPPYQAPQVVRNDKGRRGGGTTLWDKFVEQSLRLLKENGHLCLVHPAGWRDVDGDYKSIQDLLKTKTVLYLEIHDREDGVNTFGVQTAYDWYVLQNSVGKSKTIVRSQNGEIYDVDLSELEFIPNSRFTEISKLIAKTDDEKTTVIHSYSFYETRKSWMSPTQHDDFVFPCVYTTLKDATINLFYSQTNGNGHFGVPKVIFTNGTSFPIVDETGKYGLTQFAYAIVDSKEHLPLIQKAMLTERFISLMNECQLVGKHRYARKVIGCFRKDFWREFVNEDGTEKV